MRRGSRFLIGLAAALTYLTLTALVGAQHYRGDGGESYQHCHQSGWHR